MRQRDKEKETRTERYREAKKITKREGWGRKGETRMQKRGDTAPEAWDSPQLPLSALPGQFLQFRLDCPPPMRIPWCLTALTI